MPIINAQTHILEVSEQIKTIEKALIVTIINLFTPK